MATWTQQDIDRLKAAILALASGEAVQTVSYDGPPRRQLTYHAADLDKMRMLLAEMTAQVVSTSRRFRRAGFRKGFRDE